jgi:hypothetical protein
MASKSRALLEGIRAAFKRPSPESSPDPPGGRSAGAHPGRRGASLKEAGEFFGWEPARVTKTPGDFTKEELLARGWTKERLLDVAEGYEHIARITPANPSAAARARQLRELAKLLD